MESSLDVQIVSPARFMEFEEVLSVSFVSQMGSIGVLPNHADIIGELVAGSLKLKLESGEKVYAISDGFFEVRSNKLYIVTDSFAEGSAIDVERAKLAKDRAEELIKKKDGVDMIRAEAALMRALNRLRIAGKGS